MAVQVHVPHLVPVLLAYHDQLLDAAEDIPQILLHIVFVEALVLVDEVDEVEELEDELEGDGARDLVIHVLLDVLADARVDRVHTLFDLLLLLERLLLQRNQHLEQLDVVLQADLRSL